MQKTIFFLVVVLALASAADFKWNNCPGKTTQFVATSASMNPYPAKKGGSVTISTAGSFANTVTGGSFTSKTYKGSTLLASNSGQVCDGLASTCPCPCSAGPVNLSQTQKINSLAPSGEYKTIYESTDQSGNTLACIEYYFTVA